MFTGPIEFYQKKKRGKESLNRMSIFQKLYVPSGNSLMSHDKRHAGFVIRIYKSNKMRSAH